MNEISTFFVLYFSASQYFEFGELQDFFAPMKLAFYILKSIKVTSHKQAWVKCLISNLHVTPMEKEAGDGHCFSNFWMYHLLTVIIWKTANSEQKMTKFELIQSIGKVLHSNDCQSCKRMS